MQMRVLRFVHMDVNVLAREREYTIAAYLLFMAFFYQFLFCTHDVAIECVSRNE